MPSPANLLTDFILRQSYADLPEPIRHQAKRCLLDSMGALSAGAPARPNVFSRAGNAP